MPSQRGNPRTARRRHDRRAILLLVPVATLLIVGLGAVMSAGSVIGLRSDAADELLYFKRQLIWAAAGLVLLFIASRIPYRWYLRLSLPIHLAGLAGLVVVLLIGIEQYGAKRWVAVGDFTLQPSEIAKLTTLVFLAAALSRKEKILHEFAHLAWPVIGSLGLAAALIVLQKDLGTTLILVTAGFAVMLASTAPLRYLVGGGVFAVAGAVVLAVSADYRWRRVTSFLDPLADPLDSGLQAVQSRVALATGGWFGVGLGASRARWSFLPNAHTDFIFAIIGEETGFAGSIVVVLLFVGFAIAGTAIALNAPDRFGRLLAIGIVSWLSAQALVNIGGVIGALPITGVPLPFVSTGGTAMLVNLTAVGVLVNVARTP